MRQTDILLAALSQASSTNTIHHSSTETFLVSAPLVVKTDLNICSSSTSNDNLIKTEQCQQDELKDLEISNADVAQRLLLRTQEAGMRLNIEEGGMVL